MTRKPAFAYLRVSSTGQVDGHGFDRQSEAVEQFAKTNGFEVVETFQDVHTGTEANRPQFDAMLDALTKNGTRVVIIEGMDRLARDMRVQLALMDRLADGGFRLISTMTGQDVLHDDDPMNEAMVMVQAAFAQLEKKLLVRKLRKARDAKSKAAGHRIEGAPRFYTDDVVQQVRALRRRKQRATGKAWTPTMIANELNEQAVPTKDGSAWSRHAVRRLLARAATPIPSAALRDLLS